jgi:hypothetical protein
MVVLSWSKPIDGKAFIPAITPSFAIIHQRSSTQPDAARPTRAIPQFAPNCPPRDERSPAMTKRNFTVIFGALLLATLPLFARSARAAFIQTNARPIAPALGYASYYDSYLLVWAEDRGTGTGLDLYAVRLTANGIAQGVEIPLLVAPGNQSDPTMAFSSQVGEFLVFYTDDSGGQSSTGTATPGAPPPPVPGATQPVPPPATPPAPPPPPFLLGGAPIEGGPWDARTWAEVIPLNGISLESGLAEAGPIGGARLSIAVPDAAQLADLSDAQSQASDDSADAPMQPTLPIPGQPTVTPGGPTPGPGNPQPPEAPGSRDIYGLFASASGQRISNVFAVVASPADETYPDLAYMPQGGRGDRIAFVWRQVDGVDVSINSMELTPVGRYFGLSATRNVVQGGDLGRPSVAAEQPSGSYLTVWSQTPTDDATRDIYGRRMNSNAVAYGAPIRIARSKSPIDDVYPSIGSLGEYGGFILAWERRDGANAPDVQVRQLNRNGIPYRSEYALAGGAAFSFAPDISASDRPGTLVAWVDRNAASDNSILVAEVNRSGRRNGPERVVVVGGAGPAGVTPVPPPPVLLTPPVLPTP